MNTSGQFRPDWISAPGETILDMLAHRNLSLGDFARQMDQPLEAIHELIRGRAPITIAIARRLEGVLGRSLHFWMSRDHQYRQELARLLAEHPHWLADLPVNEMHQFGWLPNTASKTETLAECLHFFDVPGIAAWQGKYGTLSDLGTFKRTQTFESHLGPTATWIRRGEIETENIHCNAWNADGFRHSLQYARKLTGDKDNRRFLPKLKEICAANGVAVAVVRAPTGCRASGATKWVSESKALLLLSHRYRTDDFFWFTFFHECGHILLHRQRSIFVEDPDNPPAELEEKEANEFAENLLIPRQYRTEFDHLPPRIDAIIRFAVQIGVSPGIILGQLQHGKRIHHGQFRKLKRTFEWD